MSPFLSVISESWYSVELLSCVQLFMTPWTAAHQASLSITNSHSWLKLMSIKSVMPSSHLSLCCPLPLPPSIFVYKKRLPYITYLWESVSPIYLSRWYFWSTSYVSGTVPDLEGERWTIQRKSPPWETCILDGKHFTYKYTKGIGVLEMLFRRSKQGEKEKRVAEDEMFRYHHWLNGHEFEQTLGDSEGQGSLLCCSSGGCKQSDTT